MVKEWCENTFPAILKDAKERKALVFFEDESGVALNMPAGRTWSRVGDTPVIRRSGKRGSVTYASAVSMEGDFFFSAYEKGGMNTERYIDFIESLRRQSGKPITVIHDGLPAHRSAKLRVYFACRKDVKFYRLPGYSPQLNPDEYVWAILKDYLRKRVFKNLIEIMEAAHYKLVEMQGDKDLIKSFSRKIYPASLAT